MGALRCVDGSLLSVVAVSLKKRLGNPYEITLALARDHSPFAAIGERCGFRLARLAALVSAAREDPAQAAAWPDPDDRFPEPGDEPHVRSSLDAYLPGEREYFALRARDRTDLPGNGELRCSLRASAEWLGAVGWRLSRRAVLEAWGGSGIGVRAVLTSAELVTFLDTVLEGPGGVSLAGPVPGSAGAAGEQLGASRRPARRQRGRVPDGTARTRLPALRAPA